MKRIDSTEYKKIILDILKYIDNICRKNDIKYTLTGGTLIGAVREGKMLDWDDDIDIVLNLSDYNKLLDIIAKDKNSNYSLLDFGLDDNYPCTYAKLFDNRTIVHEPNFIYDNCYGAFVDIFVNHNTSNNPLFRFVHYYRTKVYQSLINGCLFNEEYKKNEKGIRRIRTKFSSIFGTKKLQKRYRHIISKYDSKSTDYIFKDYISFGYKKDIMEKSLFDNYIDINFNGMKAMCIKEYDLYLKNLFGDYMIPPSEDKRICHDIVAYWKKER